MLRILVLNTFKSYCVIKNHKHISILGCGWLGLPLGRHLVEKGYWVKGSSTRKEQLPVIKEKGINPFLLSVGERLEGVELDAFFKSEILVLNIPPRRRREEVAKRFPQEIKLIADAALAGGVQKVLFVSSTGVYAANNDWVTEEAVLNPATDSGKGIVAAEQVLRSFDEFKVTILRLAGLVGGDRHPGKWFAGKQKLSGGEVPVNLVHLEDCIAAITAIIDQEKWGTIFQLCADKHPLKKDYYPMMTKKLGLEPPDFSGSPVVPFKIIGNKKIKDSLNLKLKYPDPANFY